MKCFKKGYLRVSDGHRLYYEVCGNPKGIPVLFIHGGPGGGFSDSDKTFFSPNVYKVVFFDQRGAGRSQPRASLKANTTDHLVADINCLLNYLKIEKAFLFGGSWGSTLSLIYSIRYPEKVTGMLLRGIFLARGKDHKHIYQGGTKAHFPDYWERFINHVPLKARKHPERYYLKMLKSKNSHTRKKYAYEHAYYEISLCMLDLPEDKKKMFMKSFDYKSCVPIECHYMVHRCFIPENYILRNIRKIQDVPMSIVQGRYDVLCLPESAMELHAKLKNSSLHFVPAGHSAHDNELEKKLKTEMKRFGKVLK